MNVSNKASWAPNEYVAKTLIKCAQHQQPKQSVFQSAWWCHTFTLKPMYDVSLDVFVWFSRPHHLLVFINLRKRLTHYFKTSLTSPKCNGFDVIETSLPRFCARRLRNVFRTKNGSLGLSIKKSVQVVWSGFYENRIDIQIVFCFRSGNLLICCTLFAQIL